MSSKKEIQKRLLSWYSEKGRKHLLWRKNASPYRVLVAEVLLRRTRVDQVVPVFREIIEKYPDLNTLANAKQSQLEMIISPIGLKSRAGVLINSAQQIVTEHKGEIPTRQEKLQNLLGIGPYISNSILVFGYGKRRAIVDGNISRIYSRIFNMGRMKDSTRDKEMWRFAEEMLPEEGFVEYNAALLDLGASLCTHRKPSCVQCFLTDFCQYFKLAREKEEIESEQIPE